MSEITIGSRVRRVTGTFTPGLIGHVRLLEDGATSGKELALVALEHGEPGIGHQFVAPLEDLELEERTTEEFFRDHYAV